MAKQEQSESTQEFEHRCVDTLKRMRSQAHEVLNRAGTVHKAQPLKRWEKIVYPLLGMKPEYYTEFDSADDPRLAIVTRAAAGGLVTPRVRILAPSERNEMSAMEVRLSGKQPETGINVDIMSVDLPAGSNSAVQTKVILWTAPLPGRIPFYEVMDSNFAEVVDLTIRTLEHINKSLPERK